MFGCPDVTELATLFLMGREHTSHLPRPLARDTQVSSSGLGIRVDRDNPSGEAFVSLPGDQICMNNLVHEQPCS